MTRGQRPGTQRGMALMAMLAVVVLGASWWLVSALGTPNNRAALEAGHNARVLQQARSSLLGHLAHQALLASEDHPGRLPCPEAPGRQNNHDGTRYLDEDDGIAAGSCISAPPLGRLPWRTLGIDKLVDASGEPLWYVVSAGWTFPAPLINSNTPGQLMADGQAVVALIIAPGKPMNVQAAAGCTPRAQRRARQPNVAWDLQDFLECENATPADATFTVTGPRDSFNDQVVGLSAKEVWTHVEGSVAARMQRDVVPQLEGVYASAQWGASSTNPIFPHAADFGAFTVASLPTFAFKGDAARTQGLLPMTFGQCVAGSDPRCDPGFVAWNTGTIQVVKRGGDAAITSVNCSASSGSQVSCTISYGETCGAGLGSVLGGTCSVTLEASVLASAQNVGRALRTFTPTGISGFTSLVSSNTPLVNTGAANADVRGHLPPASCSLTIILAVLIPCTASNSATVSVPITVFADHPLLDPSPGTAWYWYTANNWHHVTYYAIAPSHAPSAPVHDCNAAADCLSVSGATPSAALRAMVVLAGRSLSAAAAPPRPNGDLNDFLDSLENRDGDTAYEQDRIDADFNDRVVTLSKY